MVALCLGIVCLCLLFVAIYFLLISNKLRIDNTRLNLKIKEKEDELSTQTEQGYSSDENHFLEIEQVLKNERERIAHELHDDIVQRFVSVRLRLEQLLYFALRPEVEDEINSLRTEIGNAIRDLRYVIENLVQPQIENQDLNQVIENIVAKMKLITKIKFELVIREADRAFELPPDIKKELCLLVSEGLQNSLKHSAGNIISLSVSWASDLAIEISADGVGFLKSRAANVGLNSMRQRCEKIGATFQAFNKMGRFHAVVIFTLPRPDHTSPLR